METINFFRLWQRLLPTSCSRPRLAPFVDSLLPQGEAQPLLVLDMLTPHREFKYCDDVEENKYHDIKSQGNVSEVPSTVEARVIAKKKKNPDEIVPLF
jgi:hypothetical protein